ncbi:MAG: hypothetical protein ACPIOQ_60860, partial [Promethearchaeia archaeon]
CVCVCVHFVCLQAGAHACALCPGRQRAVQGMHCGELGEHTHDAALALLAWHPCQMAQLQDELRNAIDKAGRIKHGSEIEVESTVKELTVCASACVLPAVFAFAQACPTPWFTVSGSTSSPPGNLGDAEAAA